MEIEVKKDNNVVTVKITIASQDGRNRRLVFSSSTDTSEHGEEFEKLYKLNSDDEDDEDEGRTSCENPPSKKARGGKYSGGKRPPYY